jgi:hypothetical protein
MAIRSRTKSLAHALITAMAVATLCTVGAAPAQADTCSGHNTPNNSGGYAEVEIGAPLRVGPYASCNVSRRAGYDVSQYVALNCWKLNAYGNVWWAVRTSDYPNLADLWVYNDNFYGTPPSRSSANHC